jgi:DNA-binding MarR family transcriptional regulator
VLEDEESVADQPVWTGTGPAGARSGSRARPGREPLAFDPIAAARHNWTEQGWEGAVDGMAAVTSVMRARQLMLALVEDQLHPFKLSFARYEILMLLLLSKTGALPLGMLGRRLQVHPTSITGPIDKLERQGLASRRPHPSDRRTTLAEISDRGREVARAATDALNRSVFNDLGLGTPALVSLVKVLRDFRRAQGDFV